MSRPGDAPPLAHRVRWMVAWFVMVAVVLFVGAGPSMVARSMNGVVEHTPPEPSEEAVRLHRTLRIVDLHSDALLWDRDLLRRGSWGHVDVPRLIEGRVALQGFTAVTKTPRDMNIHSNAGDSDNITLLVVLQMWPPRTWRSLAERALYQAERLGRLARASEGRLTLIRTREALAAYLDRDQHQPDITAGFLGIEGAHALEGRLENVDRLFQAGYRMLGLTHFFDNEVGGSAHGIDKGGLTAFGDSVLARADSLGMLIDLAHASAALVDDVLARTTRPVVVSHGGVRGTCDNRRNLSDHQLRGIAATGGLMGVGLWETAVCGTTPADWARAVRHAVDVMGVEYVALGSDWDGAVTAIVDAAGTVHLVQALLDEGFTEEEIRLVMGENALRVLLEVLPR